ncbi:MULTISPECIES: TlpA family protein disulfide reductase [unclassified Proteiniphilum]|jgi:thiol-disulfide isomerase/thioredoxin|uniref:TlpA family protein disulfide reductase n=1 Tax=unclassified Proteiniphilum TaxID=2622718 RepID=UPI00257996EB|nr:MULTISPECIES: TlpA disulfide reductase family protein [unclassified Proteiniphilum]
MKISHKRLFFIIFCLYTIQSFLFGQTRDKKLIISFEESNYGRNYSFLYPTKETKPFTVKNIPHITDDYIIYKVKISFLQENYNKYKNKEVSKEKFLSYIANIGVDSSYMDKIRIPQSFFYVYVGIDLENQKKYVVIDTNIDNNFGNDSLYTFNLVDYSKYNLQENPLDVNTKLRFTYNIGNIEKNTNIQLALFPFYNDKKKEEYPNITDYYLDIGLFANKTKEAKLNIQDKSYKIIAYKKMQTDLLPWHLNEKSHFDIYDNNEKYLYHHLTLGDTIVIADKMLQLEYINENNLIVNEIEDYSIMKSDIYIHSLSDNEQITLQSVIESKYVFIDFWGSWCNPCIHSIPLLKKLHEKIKHREDVLILGIAAENRKDINTLKKIIADKHILYLNYCVYTQNLKSRYYPHTVFQITEFPTYVLLDKKSNVIHKITNSKNTEMAISLFLKLIGTN